MSRQDWQSAVIHTVDVDAIIQPKRKHAHLQNKLKLEKGKYYYLSKTNNHPFYVKIIISKINHTSNIFVYIDNHILLLYKTFQ